MCLGGAINWVMGPATLCVPQLHPATSQAKSEVKVRTMSNSGLADWCGKDAHVKMGEWKGVVA